MNSVSSLPQQSIEISVLTQFLDSLESYSHELIQHLRSGQKLCHYTTLDGAISIITEGDLWLTNSRYSNDDEELNYGHRLVDEVLDEIEREVNDQGRLDWLGRLRDRVNAARGDQVYVCCFCEKDNLLSQWRGYAEGGGGVSIEFDPAGFAAIAGQDCAYGLMRLWKVFYDPQQQRKITRACIEYPYWPGAAEEDRMRWIVDALQFFMPTFKNGDFAEEQERRLIFTPYPGASVTPRFRKRRGLLVPYYLLSELANTAATPPAFRLPIQGIQLGPGPYRSLNVDSARMMLEVSGYPDVRIEASPTPYRG